MRHGQAEERAHFLIPKNSLSDGQYSLDYLVKLF